MKRKNDKYNPQSIAYKANRYAFMMEAATAYITTERPKIRMAADAAALLRPLIKNATQETLYVVFMDTRNMVLGMKDVTKGLVDRAQSHAREVFRDAIIENAARVVLVHNHPSGNPMPSSQDVECTRGLVQAGHIIGIEVMDHVVIGSATPDRPRDFVSLRELNLM